MKVSEAVSALVIEVFNHIESTKTNQDAGELKDSEWFKNACAELDETVEKYVSERIADQAR